MRHSVSKSEIFRLLSHVIVVNVDHHMLLHFSLPTGVVGLTLLACGKSTGKNHKRLKRSGTQMLKCDLAAGRVHQWCWRMEELWGFPTEAILTGKLGAFLPAAKRTANLIRTNPAVVAEWGASELSDNEACISYQRSCIDRNAVSPHRTP